MDQKYLDIQAPCKDQVDLYLSRWSSLPNYTLQEGALNKLFLETYPLNTDIRDILIKASSLNDFYSTNIFSIFPVCENIFKLNIDERLNQADLSLVMDISKIEISGKIRNFYSFATKYCSHHKPLDYPIYDSYVDKILCYFNRMDHFSDFKKDELKDYLRFNEILFDFQHFYNLNDYNLKDIDKYLWQLGKEKMPNNYGSNKKGKVNDSTLPNL